MPKAPLALSFFRPDPVASLGPRAQLCAGLFQRCSVFLPDHLVGWRLRFARKRPDVLLTPSQAEGAESTVSDYSEGMSPYRERASGICERRLRGQNWKEIALAVGVTSRRAQQIVHEHEEWLAGHIRARSELEQPREAIANELALDLPSTPAVETSRRLSSAQRRRMQRWWLERYSMEELLELGREIGWI